MDQIKTGALIRQLRNNRHLTQKQLADRIHVSDKAVSKWERGSGCPDVSLLAALADALGTDIHALLAGDLSVNEKEKGDMKKMNFYVCGTCGNILTACSDASVTCCGCKLTPLEAQEPTEGQSLTAEEIDGELCITADHPMTKEHYISFVGYAGDSTAMIFKQYPEWDLQVNMPLFRSGKLVWYCTKCGFFCKHLTRKR